MIRRQSRVAKNPPSYPLPMYSGGGLARIIHGHL